jgi:restriction system protein
LLELLELLEAAYQKLRGQVEAELLRRVRENPPEFLERVVLDVPVAMNYGGSRKDAGEALGGVGDEGIDGVIKEDPLGLDAIYVQAKRWEGSVGRPEVHKFAGALQGRRAKKGVLITTSTFSAEAQEFASHSDPKIVLIDGARLARLMFDHGIGVATTSTYAVKEPDSDYFSEA